ncbi:MAG: AHH domain-containing protein [Saprospiraceae bacterium]
MIRTIIIFITIFLLYISPIYNQCHVPEFLNDIESNTEFSDYFDDLWGTGNSTGKINYDKGFKVYADLADGGSLLLKTNTSWNARILGWKAKGIDVGFAKQGDFILVSRKSDGTLIGKIVDSHNAESFEAVAEGFVSVASPYSTDIVSAKQLDIPVKRPCGDDITSNAWIVKTSDGTVGIVEDVSSYVNNFIKEALTNPNGKLRYALEQAGLVTSTQQAHHLIPIELLEKNEVVQDAVNAGFDFNGIINGKGLSSVGNPPIHLGSHPHYTTLIESKIADWLDVVNNNGTYSPNAAKTYLETLTNQIKQAINSNPTIPINQLNF